MSKVKIRYWNKAEEAYEEPRAGIKFCIDDQGKVIALSCLKSGLWEVSNLCTYHLEPHYFYPDAMPEIIVCAAMSVKWKDEDGARQRHVFTNVRHHAIYTDPYYIHLREKYGLKNLYRVEGFVSNKIDELSPTNGYQFYDREDASILFDESGQRRRSDGNTDPSEGILYSEDYC